MSVNMRRLRILVVDDNQGAANALARVLKKGGDDVQVLFDGATAIDTIRERPPDVVLTDLKMSPVDGLQVLEAARALRPPVEVIVFTAFGAIDVAVRAMRSGARDFLTKPVSVEQIATRLDQIRGVPDAVPHTDVFDFVAASASGRRLLEQLRTASGVASPVWIEGEVGSGRTYAARAIHRFGSTDSPLVIRDLSRDEPWPQRGTVLLPEVDELPEDLQRGLVRSLRSLPEGVRLIATAEPDARRQVSSGDLKPELYYSLAVVVVQVPPLRRRAEDVMPLFERALQQHAARYNRAVPVLGERAIEALKAHTWPGNVRELSNLAERTVVMGPDAFELEVVHSERFAGLPSLEPGFSLSDYLEDVERQLLVAALHKAGGDRNQAGRILGVERNTLRYKLNKYGLLEK